MRCSPSRARFAARLVRSRARGRPHTLSHLVTTRCMARCPTCLWRDSRRAELDTPEIMRLYHEASAAGIAQLFVWGGEPLLRRDLPELLRTARQAKLTTTVTTNGWLAGERWCELRGLIDYLILSLDDVGPAHDALRGLPGLYDRLESFAGQLTRDPLRPTLLVNTVLSRVNPGALPRVAAVARRWGAGLFFSPIETGEMRSSGFEAPLASLALPPGEIQSAARLAGRLKRAGYPVLATRRYLALLARDPAVRGYTCRAPRAVLTVEPDGDVRDCLRRDRPIVSVRDLWSGGRELVGVFSLPGYREMLKAAADCAACNNSDVVEVSWLWDLHPAMLGKAARLAAA